MTKLKSKLCCPPSWCSSYYRTVWAFGYYCLVYVHSDYESGCIFFTVGTDIIPWYESRPKTRISNKMYKLPVPFYSNLSTKMADNNEYDIINLKLINFLTSHERGLYTSVICVVF